MNERGARGGDEGRALKDARLLKVLLPLAVLCGFALSRRLWYPSPGRLYPSVPVFDFLPAVAPALGYVWFAALVLLLVLVAVRARGHLYAAPFVALAAAYVLFDVSRLQPWFYQYLFMMLALAAHARGDEGARVTLRACALVVACVYFWSGVQKLNPQFSAEVLPSLVAPYLDYMPALSSGLATKTLGVFIPLTEICAGLMLLTRRWRPAGVVLALTTHAVVLLLFVPARRNNVIWPWNVATAAFVLILFQGGADGARDFLPRRLFSLQTAALVLFGLMPFLSLFGLWGQYLSSALYSGNVARAEFTLSERVGGRLPTRVRQKLRRVDDGVDDGEGGFRLDLGHWSYAELNVPPFPSDKVYRAAAATLCGFAETSSDVWLEVRERPRFFGGAAHATAFDCDAFKVSR